MLGSPSPTPYDLRFRALGIPVRVHPFFWLITAFLRESTDLRDILLFVLCAFISILVHEYGHGLTARAFGYSASITLYGMGGLCYSEAERQTPWQRVTVLAAGPGIQLLLAAGLFYGWRALGMPELGPIGGRIWWDLIIISLFWAIFNLLPIWPMDGGQLTLVILSMFSRRSGARWAHIISMLLAALLAVLAATRLRDMFYTIFFGFFAFMNFMQLQNIHEASRYGLDDDADWWRR
ncbi:MAG TPA: site-2 protease family protein [Isosphaeraceae bacterium]|nr:site-2 protease family protein [Isosphaeraceae bacterium]